MIDQRALREAHFSDDLRPHMQGGACIFPLREGERGPGLFFVGDFVVRHFIDHLCYQRRRENIVRRAKAVRMIERIA